MPQLIPIETIHKGVLMVYPNPFMGEVMAVKRENRFFLVWQDAAYKN